MEYTRDYDMEIENTIIGYRYFSARLLANWKREISLPVVLRPGTSAIVTSKQECGPEYL